MGDPNSRDLQRAREMFEGLTIDVETRNMSLDDCIGALTAAGLRDAVKMVQSNPKYLGEILRLMLAKERRRRVMYAMNRIDGDTDMDSST